MSVPELQSRWLLLVHARVHVLQGLIAINFWEIKLINLSHIYRSRAAHTKGGAWLTQVMKKCSRDCVPFFCPNDQTNVDSLFQIYSIGEELRLVASVILTCTKVLYGNVHGWMDGWVDGDNKQFGSQAPSGLKFIEMNTAAVVTFLSRKKDNRDGLELWNVPRNVIQTSKSTYLVIELWPLESCFPIAPSQ